MSTALLSPTQYPLLIITYSYSNSNEADQHILPVTVLQPQMIKLKLQQLQKIPKIPENKENTDLHENIVKVSEFSFLHDNNRVYIVGYGARRYIKTAEVNNIMITGETTVICLDDYQDVVEYVRDDHSPQYDHFHDASVINEITLRVTTAQNFLNFYTENQINSHNMLISIAKTLGYSIMIVNPPKVLASRANMSRMIFESWLKLSIRNKKVMVIICDFHLILMQKKMKKELAHAIRRIHKSDVYDGRNLAIIGTTHLVSKQRFEIGTYYTIPKISTEATRAYLLDRIETSELGYEGSDEDDADLTNLLTSARELNHLKIEQILNEIRRMQETMIDAGLVKIAMKKLKFTLPAEVVLAQKSTTVDVGGNVIAKTAIKDALASDFQLFNRMGITPPTNLLFYGPPGTGKTLLARYAASLSNSAFISICASEVVHSTYGSSEKVIHQLFVLARQHAPSLVFIDEFDSLFSQRSSGSSGRLTSTLLNCLDDCNFIATSFDGSNKLVRVLAASNAPWRIDPAFFTRFHCTIHVGLPSGDDLLDVLYTHISKMKLCNNTDTSTLCPTVLEWMMQQHGPRYSGADIRALCRAAAVRCMLDPNTSDGVCLHHFEKAIMHDITPSCDSDTIQRCAEWSIRNSN